MLGIEPAREPLPSKEWHSHLEGLLNTGQLNPDIIPYLDARQMWCLNEIKKTFIRIEKRNENNQH